MHTVQDRNQADLKAMELMNDQAATLQSFDISKQVMDRIYRTVERKSLRAPSLRMRPRAAVPAMAIILVLGASVTAYAATQYLEFRNSKGEVVMKTGQAGETSEKYTALLSEYVTQVQDQLQPGDYAAYYVKDDFIKQMDQSNPVKFTYKEQQFKSFSSLQDEISRTSAPALQPVTALPAGYQFDYGYVYPSDMFPSLLHDQNYQAITNELVAEANSSTIENKVFVQKMEWNKAGFTLARYTNGEDQITVSVRAYDPATTLTTIIQNDSDSAEKITLNGVEAYYIDLNEKSRQTFQMKHRLGWMDEANHLYFEIYDSENSQLTKQALVDLAVDVLEAK
ncbi:hypothetical protein PCCS19_38940 [Paenibacillus sp. CCS19]|uniref:DUF4367 domain-containing protein n=1 Tax=Paenibacillus sp. CCS19 TaxID=3158387 RepID=UPI002562E1BF|nr:DUF4367 domain-containing protein [Paenibacillus cellulosilyticus]GMK40838.1 hypothetical protein PCCS19_38940 [Paenibacillus cellulosilyticus]